MRTLDFSRSFVTFVVGPPEPNEARIQVEARCTIHFGPDTEPEEYLLVASCKSENTHAEKDLFKEPNYDFCAIFSDTEYRIHRVGLTADDHDMEAGDSAERFDDVVLDLRYLEAEELADGGSIVQATRGGRYICCRTTLEDDDSERTAVLEYPVKTINVRSDSHSYQVDTGPVLLPGFWPDAPVIEGFRLAYIAHNRPDSADFVIQEPTPVDREDPESLRVMHYSRTYTTAAENRLYACD